MIIVLTIEWNDTNGHFQLKSENRSRNINNFVKLLFHIGNKFEIPYTRWPDCGSSKVIKQEYYPRNLKLAEFGHQSVYVRRYYCKTCKKKFSTQLDVIMEKGFVSRTMNP